MMFMQLLPNRGLSTTCHTHIIKFSSENIKLLFSFNLWKWNFSKMLVLNVHRENETLLRCHCRSTRLNEDHLFLHVSKKCRSLRSHQHYSDMLETASSLPSRLQIAPSSDTERWGLSVPKPGQSLGLSVLGWNQTLPEKNFHFCLPTWKGAEKLQVDVQARNIFRKSCTTKVQIIKQHFRWEQIVFAFCCPFSGRHFKNVGFHWNGRKIWI